MIDKKVSNTQTIKCVNCGAVNCKEKHRGVYKCNYCGTTFKHKDTETVDFDASTEDNSFDGENIYYFKPTISKEEFFKRAIIYLGMKNYTPDDILTATFEDVKMDYFSYLVMHVNFKAVLKAGDKNKEVISRRRILCQKMSPDVASEQERQLLDKIDYLDGVDDSKVLTKTTKKKLKINLPTEEEIKKESAEVLLAHKEWFKNEVAWKATTVEHKIDSTEIYLVPEYYLEFTYKGQLYKVMSFANELKIVGNTPDISKEVKSTINKKSAKLYYPSIILSGFLILYAIILAVLRLKYLIPFQFIAIIATVVSYILAIVYEKKLLNRIKSDIFDERVKMLEDYFNRENLELTPLDYDYMNNYKGGC